MAPLLWSSALLLFSLLFAPSPNLAASVPSEFRTGEFVPTARRVQYHGMRSRWVDLASKHCPRFGSDGLLAIPLPAPIIPSTKKQRKHHDGIDSPPLPLLHGTYKVQFAFDGERVLTPWLTVAREDLLDGKSRKKRRKKSDEEGAIVADVPVVDLVLARAGRELLGGGASRARVSRAPQDYVAAHGGLADEWRTTERLPNSSGGGGGGRGGGGPGGEVEQRWPRTLPVRVRWAARPGADLAAGASTLLLASLLAALLASLASLAGHGSALRGLVEGAVAAGAEEAEEVLMGGSSGVGGGVQSVQLATTAAGPSTAAAAAAFQRQPQQQHFQYHYQYQQQQQAPAPQPRPQQQQFVPQPAPASSSFVPAPAAAPRAPPPPPPSSSLPLPLQQQQPLPSITPPPASFTPQQQYAYYQQIHSYQRQQQQGQQGQQQQRRQAPPFHSQQQPAAAPPPPFQQQQQPPSSSKAD